MYDTVMDLIDQRDTAKAEMAKSIHARFIAGQHANHIDDHDFPEVFANYIVDLEAQIIDDPAYKAMFDTLVFSPDTVDPAHSTEQNAIRREITQDARNLDQTIEEIRRTWYDACETSIREIKAQTSELKAQTDAVKAQTDAAKAQIETFKDQIKAAKTRNLSCIETLAALKLERTNRTQKNNKHRKK
jgi:septal ring factor EnvC (AmiA/AmiB activator)